MNVVLPVDREVTARIIQPHQQRRTGLIELAQKTTAGEPCVSFGVHGKLVYSIESVRIARPRDEGSSLQPNPEGRKLLEELRQLGPLLPGFVAGAGAACQA